MACKTSGFRSYRQLDGPLIGNVRAQPRQLNLTELTCVISQMCAAIPQLPQQYIYRHILSMSTPVGMYKVLKRD